MILRPFLLIACFVSALVLAPASGHAQADYGLGLPGADVQPGKDVTASLIADHSVIAPGQRFHVAIVLKHAPEWHSYWRNPGGFSLPVKATWIPPDGFVMPAGEMVWPVPHQTNSQGFPAYTNPDPTILVAEMVAPANLATGGTFTLKAKVEGQVCKESCVIFDQDVAIQLQSAATATVNPANRKIIADALAASPKPLGGWTASASETPKGITLTLSPAAGAAALTDAYFFPYTTDIDTQSPQPLEVKDGKLVLTLKRPEDDTITKGTRLTGVLKSKTPWLKDDPTSTAVVLDVAIAGKDAAAAAGAPAAKPLSFSLLGIAFLGGLILNLMPCVFPVLGLKIMNFVNQAGEDHRKVMLHGVMFTAGVLLSFWALAGIIIAVKAGTGQQDLAWGFQLQDARFVLLMAATLFIFSLSLSGLFEFGTAATSVGGNLARKSGLSGSFFSGVLATLVATPCAAPFLAPALGVALAMPPLPSLVMFTAIALGLSMPYLVLSAFPRLIDKLPRPGAWMETFKKLMAFPMYATTAWLVWVLSQQVDADKFLWVMFAFTLMALGIYILGQWGQPWQKSSTKWTARFACLAVLGGSLALAWPSPNNADEVVQWEPWSPERVAALRAENRPVFIDFTAAWCATCKANKLRYTHDKTVIGLMAKKGVIALKADFTNKDAAIAKAIAAYGRRAVPVNVLYAPGAAEPDFLPELFGAGEVIDRLTPLPDWKGKN